MKILKAIGCRRLLFGDPSQPATAEPAARQMPELRDAEKEAAGDASEQLAPSLILNGWQPFAVYPRNRRQ